MDMPVKGDRKNKYNSHAFIEMDIKQENKGRKMKILETSENRESKVLHSKTDAGDLAWKKPTAVLTAILLTCEQNRRDVLHPPFQMSDNFLRMSLHTCSPASVHLCLPVRFQRNIQSVHHSNFKTLAIASFSHFFAHFY